MSRAVMPCRRCHQFHYDTLLEDAVLVVALIADSPT
jgi:hypothetical protein